MSSLRIVESSGFLRTYARLVKRRPEIRTVFEKQLRLFVQDPFHPKLKTHKLSGDLKDSWAFSLTHKLRVVFFFIEPDYVVFEDIGTHDDVY